MKNSKLILCSQYKRGGDILLATHNKNNFRCNLLLVFASLEYTKEGTFNNCRYYNA